MGNLVEEGQALLGELMKRPAAKTVALRDALEMASDKLASYQASATGMARRGARQGMKYARRTDQYVHANPWPVVAGGIALGILASLLWSQRR